MSEIKWVSHEFEQSIQLSRIEEDSLIRHCIWSQNADDLRMWFDGTPPEDVVIHIAGTETRPVVLEVDPNGPISVLKGPSMHEAFGLPDEEMEYRLVIGKGEALRVLEERSTTPDEQVLVIAKTYSEVLRPRIQGKPFVHLTVGKRALPIDVPYNPD